MAVVLKGLYDAFLMSLYNPLRTIGSPVTHENIDLRIDPISPRRRRVSAGLHATDTLWHAYIDFLTYSDDYPSRQSGLCPSRERSRMSIVGVELS